MFILVALMVLMVLMVFYVSEAFFERWQAMVLFENIYFLQNKYLHEMTVWLH